MTKSKQRAWFCGCVVAAHHLAVHDARLAPRVVAELAVQRFSARDARRAFVEGYDCASRGASRTLLTMEGV